MDKQKGKKDQTDNGKIKKITYKSTWPTVGPKEIDINK